MIELNSVIYICFQFQHLKTCFSFTFAYIFTCFVFLHLANWFSKDVLCILNAQLNMKKMYNMFCLLATQKKSGFQASRPSTSLSLSTLQARPSSSLSCSTTQASRPSSSQSVSPLQASRPFSGLSISPIGNRSRSLERGSSRSPASRRSRSPVRRRQPRILPDLETDNSRRSHSKCLNKMPNRF